MSAIENDQKPSAQGAAVAAFLAAGIGAFAMGVFVILNESGLFAAPTIYAPAGGVSGRTTFAAAAWLIAWAVLHAVMKNRRIESRLPSVLGLILIAAGVILCLPPVWGLF